MKVAKFIKDTTINTKNPNTTQKLWKVNPPFKQYELDLVNDDNEYNYYNYVITSATTVFSIPETYVFGADENGNILDFGELLGSFKGGLDHIKALQNADYNIIEGDDKVIDILYGKKINNE